MEEIFEKDTPTICLAAIAGVLILGVFATAVTSFLRRCRNSGSVDLQHDEKMIELERVGYVNRAMAPVDDETKTFKPIKGAIINKSNGFEKG